MNHKLILILALLVLFFASAIVSASASPALKVLPTSPGGKSWAYYPYNPASPWTGGKWSVPNTGTGSFIVVPGTTVARQVTITASGFTKGNTIYVSVTGLPAAWPVVLNPAKFLYGENTKTSGSNQIGYGSFYVSVPSNAALGVYTYTIRATCNGVTSTISDTIDVSKGPIPIPLVNPGFETGSFKGWDVYIAPNDSADQYNAEISTDAHSGRYGAHLYSEQFNPNGGGAETYMVEISQPITAHAGDTITLTFWAKAKTEGLETFAIFSTGTPGSDDMVPISLSPQWTKYTITHKIIDDEYGTRIGIDIWWYSGNNGVAIDDLYFDDFQATITYP